MEVLTAGKAGFCFGVKRAVEIAIRTAEQADGPVYTLGPLIHNPAVVESLKQRGVKPIENLSGLGDGTLIVRSHGAPPETIAAARARGLRVVDATCPCVSRAQRLAERLRADGYQVVVVGDPSHPEIKGVAAAAGEALVVADLPDLAGVKLEGKVGLVCQTTLTMETLARVAGAVAAACRETIVHNTICTATHERQQAAMELAGRVEAMVVVGGRQSTNTAHLAELCRRMVRTYQVERAAELDPAWFEGCARVGLTAGASTPAEQIEAVRRRLEDM